MNMLGKHFVCIFQFGNARKGEGGKYCLKGMKSHKKDTRMNIFYVTMKSESTYKSMEYAQHSVEEYYNSLGKYSNSIEKDCNAKQRRCQGWRGLEL